MIEKITLANFQSHEQTRLKFSPNVNVIIGESDSGKSAILRALKWVCYNKPRGDGFRSHWGGDTIVKVHMKEGIVTRIKKNNENSYRLKSSGNSVTYKASGNQIPEDISAVLNMEELNLQQQIEAPYLFSETPGAVAQHFSKIANLEKIYTSVKAAQSEIRSINKEIEFSETNINSLDVALEDFDDLKKLTTLVSAAQTNQKNISNNIESINAINEIITELENIASTYELYRGVTKFSWKVDLAFELIATWKKADAKYKQISTYYTELVTVDARMKILDEIVKADLSVSNALTTQNNINIQEERESGLNSAINTLNSILQKEEECKNIIRAAPKVKKCDVRLHTITTVGNAVFDIEEFIDNIDVLDIHIARAIEAIKLYEKEYAESMPDTCPLCGSKIK